MPTPDPALEINARQYAAKQKFKLGKFLGGGNDGDVWESDQNTAVKALRRVDNFQTELECYQRLRDRGMTKILGLAVPRLVDWEQDLMTIEMEILSPPCLI